MASYSVSTLDTSQFEGSKAGGFTTYTYTITRTGDLSVGGSVDWRLIVGPPAPANVADFKAGTATTGTAVFAANVATATIVFSVNQDLVAEPTEGFGVQIVNPSAGDTIGTDAAYSIIKDDDALHFLGTAKSDVLDNSSMTKGAVGDMSQGGDDKVTGTDFDDTVLYGAAFTSADKFIGGKGFDRIVLTGDYSAGVSLTSGTLQGVEEIDFVDGFDYKLTIANATVAAGGTLVVEAALSGAYGANVNAATEADGHIFFLGGAGNDVFVGGKVEDTIDGDYGADQLNGGKGADVFVYEEWRDSPLVTDLSGNIFTSVSDLLVSFQASSDRIDLSKFGLLGDQTAVLNSSTKSFTTDLSAGTGFFGTAGVVVEYAKIGKTASAQIYVDSNKDGDLNAGDMLIQATGVAKGSITATNFVF